MDLLFIRSLPVGDKGSGHIPSIKAVSVHQDPTVFNGGTVKNVLAVLTSEAVLIYHNNMDNSWNKILRHRWMEDVVVDATTLDWHPCRPELFVGDEKGHISVFKYEPNTDEAICSYTFDCVYIRESQKICCLSWSPDGKYLVATFNHDLVIFRPYRDGFKKKHINLRRGPYDYIVKFHPKLPYFFVCASNSPFLQVFTNLTPDMKEHTDWKVILCTDCTYGIRAICCDEAHWRMDSSVFLATAGKSPRVWRFHGYKCKDGVICEPKLDLVNILLEDDASKGQLNSVAFRSVDNIHIVCGFDNGSFSIYTGIKMGTTKRDARGINKGLVFVQSKRKWAEHKLINPSVTCLACEPPEIGSDFLFVGGSHGFVQIFKFLNEKDEEPAFSTVAVGTKSIERDIETEINYYVSPSSKRGLGVIGTHQQIALSSFVPDILQSNPIPGQEQIQASRQQQQGLQSTCLSLQHLVNDLQKQLEAAQEMPKEQMPSQLLKQQSALQATYISSQDLLRNLQELLQLIQQ